MFDDKVREKREELLRTEQELDNNRRALQMTPFVGTTLQHLFKHGISESDIISISQIVTDFANGKSQLVSRVEDTKDSKASNGSAIDNNDGTKRADYWKSFIRNLRKLGDINFTIEKQQETQAKIRKETIELNRQKQALFAQCQTLVSFINTTTKQIYHFNRLVDHYYGTVNKKTSNAPALYPPLLNIICVYFDKQDKDKGET